jgi:hypothetical protein
VIIEQFGNISSVSPKPRNRTKEFLKDSVEILK